MRNTTRVLFKHNYSTLVINNWLTLDHFGGLEMALASFCKLKYKTSSYCTRLSQYLIISFSFGK